jgi:hypothetical protein
MSTHVRPAKAGIRKCQCLAKRWPPAFAGVTIFYEFVTHLTNLKIRLPRYAVFLVMVAVYTSARLCSGKVLRTFPADLISSPSHGQDFIPNGHT